MEKYNCIFVINLDPYSRVDHVWINQHAEYLACIFCPVRFAICEFSFSTLAYVSNIRTDSSERSFFVRSLFLSSLNHSSIY